MPNDLLLMALAGLAGAYVGLIAVLVSTSLLPLIVGPLTGLRADTILLGRFAWLRMGDRWTRVTAGSWLSMKVGFNMSPKDGVWTRNRVMINQWIHPILLLLMAVVGILLLKPWRATYWHAFFAGAIAVVFAIAIGLGVRFLIESRRPGLAALRQDVSKLMMLMRLPMRTREWDRDVIERVLAAVTKNPNDLWIHIVSYSHFWDCGERERASEVLHAGEPLAEGPQILIGNRRSYWFERAYVYAVLFRDLRMAQEAFEKADRVSGDFANHARARSLMAIKLMEGDLSAARNALDQYRIEVERMYVEEDPRRNSSPEWIGELENDLFAQLGGR